MTPLQIIYVIMIILGIMYTGLTLYFEHRLDKLNKEYEERFKNTRTTKERIR